MLPKSQYRAALAALLLAGGCTSYPQLVPVRGGDHARADSGGLTLFAYPNRWNADPYDLPRYLTPIAVEIRNHSNRPIRVTYADFSLTSDRGQRFSAVNPFAASRAFGEYTPATEELLDHAVAQRRMVYTPAPAFSGPRMGGYRSGPIYPTYVNRPFVNSYQVYPHYMPYRSYPYRFSVLWNPYPSTYLYPPGYWDSVSYWGGYSGYPAPRPPESVLATAIPEGVIQPGGSVGGFLYFQEATSQSTSLRLVWDAFDSTQPLAQAAPQQPGTPPPPLAPPTMVARLMVDFGIVR